MENTPYDERVNFGRTPFDSVERIIYHRFGWKMPTQLVANKVSSIIIQRATI